MRDSGQIQELYVRRFLLVLLAVGALTLLGSIVLQAIKISRYSALTAELRSPSPVRREAAVKSMRGGGPETVAVMVEALQDDNPQVRRDAARALGTFDQETLQRGMDPIPALEGATRDADREVQAAAAESLLKIRQLRGL